MYDLRFCVSKRVNSQLTNHYSLFAIFFFLSLVSFSQNLKLCPQKVNKELDKKVAEVEKLFKSLNNYDKAKELAEEIIAEDSLYAKPFLLLGDAAYRKKEFKTMVYAYNGLINACPDAAEKAYYRVATYYFDTKKYDECVPLYKSFLEFNGNDTIANDDAEQKMFRAHALTHPVPFKPLVLKDVSTADPEYLPIISADNELCFFTRRYEFKGRDMLTPTSVEKFMVSEFKNNKWTTGEPMPFPFNKQNSNNEGGASISIDNQHLFFTSNVKGNFDIYTSDFGLSGWSEPRTIGDNVNDKRQWDSQPSISPDGRTLYFASYRDSISQTSDIYKTERKNGHWTNPLALTDGINTLKNEKSPFIHPDGRTFYFSSDGLPGMGGYDIYVCKADDNGNWGKPVNIGYPINTENDEVGFFVSTDGKRGYFASNKINTSGYDIYYFDLYDKIQPAQAFVFKGKLNDSDDDDIPRAAQIEIKNIASKQVTQIDYDTLTGKFAGVLLFNNDYLLTVKKDGYAFTSKYIEKKDSAKAVTVDFDIKKVKEGQSYKLNDILFESDSYELTEMSKQVIKDFSEFLKANPTIRVGIHGHTDNEGNPANNLLLSKNRAKAVYMYLISLGIAPGRLTHEGFGQTKPIASNAASDGRSLNRRTEFFILKK